MFDGVLMHGRGRDIWTVSREIQASARRPVCGRDPLLGRGLRLVYQCLKGSVNAISKMISIFFFESAAFIEIRSQSISVLGHLS